MTQPVNYDLVASAYDKRYETNYYDGVEAVLARFISGLERGAFAEVGCGTGHWLAHLSGRVRTVAGVDLSLEMLKRARTSVPSALVVRGRAEKLPWMTAVFDRLFCINALHHFEDAGAFIAEARRVLRPGGALLTIGLDPHTGLDRWWIYDYFPTALQLDRARYMATSTIRDRLHAAGFEAVTTEVAQHRPIDTPFAARAERGGIDRCSASQLMVLSDAEFEEGLRRLNTEQPTLYSDLRLYATIGCVAPGVPAR